MAMYFGTYLYISVHGYVLWNILTRQCPWLCTMEHTYTSVYMAMYLEHTYKSVSMAMYYGTYL